MTTKWIWWFILLNYSAKQPESIRLQSLDPKTTEDFLRKQRKIQLKKLLVLECLLWKNYRKRKQHHQPIKHPNLKRKIFRKRDGKRYIQHRRQT